MMRNLLATSIGLIAATLLYPVMERQVALIVGERPSVVIPAKNWSVTRPDIRTLEPFTRLASRYIGAQGEVISVKPGVQIWATGEGHVNGTGTRSGKNGVELHFSGGYSFGFPAVRSKVPAPQREQSDALQHVAYGGTWNSSIAFVKPDSGPASGNTKVIFVGDSRPQTVRLGRNEWYSLDLEGSVDELTVEYRADNCEEYHFVLHRTAGATERAAWIRFNRPGKLIIHYKHGAASVRETTLADVLPRFRDITTSKGLLSALYFYDLLLLLLYLFGVFVVRFAAYKMLIKLPRLQRSHAWKEVNLYLNVAKWTGVVSYVVFSAKEILVGIAVLPTH